MTGWPWGLLVTISLVRSQLNSIPKNFVFKAVVLFIQSVWLHCMTSRPGLWESESKQSPGGNIMITTKFNPKHPSPFLKVSKKVSLEGWLCGQLCERPSQGRPAGGHITSPITTKFDHKQSCLLPKVSTKFGGHSCRIFPSNVWCCWVMDRWIDVEGSPIQVWTTPNVA